MQRSANAQREHDAWRADTMKFYALFKVKPCALGRKCGKGINCMDNHGDHDRRRRIGDDGTLGYAAAPCPAIFDFHGTKRFYHDKGCAEGDSCHFSHNYMELGYHPDAYKVDACPYLELTRRGGYVKEECPFARDEQWFRSRFDVKKVRGNVVTLRGIDKVHLCLDMCCFWHSEKDRRFIGDAPMPPPRQKQNEAQSVQQNEQKQPM